MFAGGVADSDDIVHIASTWLAMSRMPSTCDSFADNFLIVYNAKKSKCLILEPSCTAGSFINSKACSFTLEVMQLRLVTNPGYQFVNSW